MAYNAAAGVVQTSHKLALPRWGFLTWAAKPSVRNPQTPQYLNRLRPASPLRRPSTHLKDYAPIKVPLGCVVIVLSWTMAASFG